MRGFPPSYVQRVEIIVDTLLHVHTGGVPFFDALDAEWRSQDNSDIVAEFYCYICEDKPKDSIIIGSGRFGMLINNFARLNDPGTLVLVAPGGLRSGCPMDDMWYLNYLQHKQHPIVFVDDSLYSEKTRDTIAIDIGQSGFRFGKTYVIYDGMKQKDDTVSSLYRYYDHH